MGNGMHTEIVVASLARRRGAEQAVQSRIISAPCFATWRALLQTAVMFTFPAWQPGAGTVLLCQPTVCPRTGGTEELGLCRDPPSWPHSLRSRCWRPEDAMSLAMLLPPRDTVQRSLYGEQNTCSKA